jgi:hypothetical protein
VTSQQHFPSPLDRRSGPGEAGAEDHQHDIFPTVESTAAARFIDGDCGSEVLAVVSISIHILLACRAWFG